MADVFRTILPINDATNFIKENIGTIAVGAGSAILGGAVGYLASSASGSTRKKRRKSRNKNRKRHSSNKKRKLKFGSRAYRKKYLHRKRRGKQRQPHTAGKRKDTSHRRIRFTKNNQPYIITSSGKAKFIKRSSVRNRRKRSGGSY